MLNNEHRHAPLEKSKNPFTCGISGRTYTALEAKERVSFLARALSKDLGFEVNKGTEWDKVIGLYALNTVSYCTLCLLKHCMLWDTGLQGLTCVNMANPYCS